MDGIHTWALAFSQAQLSIVHPWVRYVTINKPAALSAWKCYHVDIGSQLPSRHFIPSWHIRMCLFFFPFSLSFTYLGFFLWRGGHCHALKTAVVASNMRCCWRFFTLVHLWVFFFFMSLSDGHDISNEKVVVGVVGGSSFVCDDKGHTARGAGPGLLKKCSIITPCEKFPVPRTWCVRLEGNNSSAPLTSSFGLAPFMTLHSAIQLLSTQPRFTPIGWNGRAR